jgi:hypothetical protein
MTRQEVVEYVLNENATIEAEMANNVFERPLLDLEIVLGDYGYHL